MKNYGLTKIDLLACKEKLKNQLDYLKNNELITKNGQVKTLLDLSFSANHSYRYYAQLANKINTMDNIALNERLVPNFLTMTLDGFYRDLLKGDYSRYNAFREDKKILIAKSVPENEKLGFIRTKMNDSEPLSVKDLYNILNYQIRQFRKGVAFKNLKKANKKYIYIRTVEPHKDGVPHFHMMLFVPPEFVDDFKKDFKRFFVAPQNQKEVAFQTEIKSASAYIMKYITKSFLDIKKGNDLDYINAWFVKHRIMRCVTSRSVLPQWVYQKCSIFEKDWSYLTDILSSPQNHSEWSKEHDSFWIYDTWSDREIEYLHGRLSVYSKGYLVKRVGEVAPKKKLSYSKQYEKTPKTWTKQKKFIPIFENGKITKYYRDGKIIQNKQHITDMSNYELYEYYRMYDVENSNYTHYMAVRNLLISRKVLSGEIYNLNNFNISEVLF